MKVFHYNYRTILTLGFSMLLFFSLNAQEKAEIRLLDQDTYLPIAGATFQYGNQSGLSDESGLIVFSYLEGKPMELSHLNYGAWQLSPLALSKALRNKIAYRKSIFQNLYPVTVIALRSEPSPGERLALEYQDRMAHDGAAILNQTPALNSIRKSGAYGFDPVFRGFKYDQLNIVLNGAQSATAACPNRMDPPTSQMAPNMMDRIELLKGPHALRYGSGFGGTINFIPSKLRFTASSDLYGRVSTAWESNGSVFRTEGQMGFSGNTYDLSLSGAWSQGSDYRTGNGQTVAAGFQRGSLGANLGVKLSSQQQLRVSALYNLARNADFPALPMDLRTDDTWLFHARHDVQLDRGKWTSWNTTVFASFVDHLMDNRLKPLDPRTMNAETAATTHNYGGRTEGVWQFANGSLFAGADLRVEGAEGTRIREFLMGPNAGKVFADNAWQNSQISKTGLFAEYRHSWNTYRLILSGRLELNHAALHDDAEEFTQVYATTESTQINPNISVGLTRQLDDDLKIGLWLGRAQRSGSLTERFINYFPVGQDPYEMLGNPDLNPEINNQIDLALNWNRDRTRISLDLFAAYLQDFISSAIDPTLSPRLPMSPGVRRFINIRDAFKTGLELNWSQELGLGLHHQLGAAYTYAQDLEREGPLPEIAPLDLRYTLRGSYLDGRLQPQATFRQVWEQNRISAEFGETATPSFALLDVQIAFGFSERVKLIAGVNNLLDAQYYEHLNRSVRGTQNPIFAPGRNFSLSMSASF